MTGRLRITAALVVFLVCFLSGLNSCTSDGDTNDGERDTTTGDAGGTVAGSDLDVVRGHYVYGHEVRSLRPCGEDDALWVVDRTNLLKGLHGELTSGNTRYAEIFVVAAGRIGPPMKEGFGADYSGALAVEDVIYAASEGFGCDFDLSRFIYRALGNEPFWMVEVRENEMSLTRPGHPTLMWTDVNPKQVGGRVVLQAGGDDRPTVELVIEEGPRRDTMSGAYFGLSATLVLDGETFNGHALRGTTDAGFNK